MKQDCTRPEFYQVQLHPISTYHILLLLLTIPMYIGSPLFFCVFFPPRVTIFSEVFKAHLEAFWS